MNRRDFVRSLPAVPTSMVMAAGTLSVSACGGLAYLTPAGDVTRLRVAASLVPEAGVLLQRPDLAQPILLRPDGDGGFTALLLRCTHRGCQPDPVGDRLVCPCHGSEFDRSGGVLQGPAESALTRYPVEAVDGELVVVIGGGR